MIMKSIFSKIPLKQILNFFPAPAPEPPGSRCVIFKLYILLLN